MNQGKSLFVNEIAVSPWEIEFGSFIVGGGNV